MVKIYKTILFILFIVSINNLNAQITLNATSGTTTGSYTTLKAAIININNGTHQGIIDIRVHDNTTETDSISLDSTSNPTGSNYTSILIRPADTATVVKNINCSAGGTTIFKLNGADNVTVDGRVLSSGSTSLLKINSTAVITASYNIRLINGAQNNTFSFLQSNCILNPASGVTIIHVLFSSGTSTTGNSSNTFKNNVFTGGSQGFQFGGSAAAATQNNLLYQNIIQDYKTLGILLSNGIGSVTIDSNVIKHNGTFNSIETAGLYGIDINFIISNSTINITRNTIADLSFSAAVSTTGFYGIRIFPQTAGVTLADVNVYNNAISLTRTNSTVTGNQIFQGIRFSGTQPVNVNIINNTIRIGGSTTTVLAGAINSIGIMKANTSVTSSFVSRNNVVINERVTNNGGCAGFWLSSTAGTNNVDYNNYYVPSGNYNAIWLTGAHTTTATFRTAATPNEQNTTFDFVNFVSSSNLSLAGSSINNYVVMNCPRSSSVLSDIFGTSRLILTYKGVHQSTPFSNLKDASVKEVYSLGKLPIPYANPHNVKANVRNTGIDTIFNQKVILTIAGSNSFIDSVYIDTLAPGSGKTVTFSSFNYVNLGTCTATVSVPNDSNNTNNSKVYNQIITTGTYAFADPTLPSVAGGVGFTGGTGDFVAKFPYTGSNNINQIGITIGTGGQTIKVGIWDTSATGGPGALLWSSAPFLTTTGVNTIMVNPPVPVTGSFCVGVIQFNTTNASFGFQYEDPMRSGTFFYTFPTGATTWTDFGSNNSAYRFMVEPRLQVADDIGLASVEQPCAAVMTGSSAIAPQFKITNYGLNGQASYIVRSQITGPVNSTTADTISLYLANGETEVINSTTLFNPTTPGTYTVKAWTQLAGDLESNNDTTTYTFTVITPDTINSSGKGLQLSGTQYLQTNGDKTLNITNEKLTLEAWVKKTSNANDNYIISKDSTANYAQYDLYISAAGNLVFKLKTTIAVDSVISSVIFPSDVFTHAAATYDGVNMNIYQNGSLVGSKAMFGTITGNNQPVFVGKSISTNNGFLNGAIDEVRIWDTCRTELQIRRNMHTRLPNASHVNLKAYYRLDELSVSGSYSVDASGNCNAGIINNAPTNLATNFPLGTPVVNNQTISSSGTQAFAGTGINMNIYNQIASNDIYVHRFSDSPLVVSPVTAPGGVSSVYGNYWLMYRYGAGTMDSADVTFNLVGMVNGANANDFKLFNRASGSSATWTLAKNYANSFSLFAQTVTMGVDSTMFNKQFIIGATNNPLPVKLISFTGNAKNENANLYWSTASEINNNGFAIERSLDGKKFIEIGFVKGAVNSNQLTNYNFVDGNVFLVNKAVFYRLKQIDLNGEFEYSKTISIVNGKDISTQVIVYPNPITDQLFIEIESFENANTQLNITDITGKIIKDIAINLTAGYNKFAIENLNELTNGIYMVNIVSNGTVLYNNKFVKVK